jgi:hypothetical protein
MKAQQDSQVAGGAEGSILSTQVSHRDRDLSAEEVSRGGEELYTVYTSVAVQCVAAPFNLQVPHLNNN